MTAALSNKAIDKLIWVLIYGGLLLVSLGIFVRRADDGLGWALAALGAFIAYIGVVLIWVRSRRAPDDDLKPKE